MIIYVVNNEIETKDIIKIEEAVFRTHGFIIHLTGNRSVNITKPENYDMSTGAVASINDRYSVLRKKVEAEWEKDKINHIVLDL